jgi:hypothetical protein
MARQRGTLAALKHMLPADRGHVIQIGSAVADHPRRELWIVVGQRVIPDLLDRYLGRMGYGAQQTSRRAAPGRPDDVDRPLPGDRGAHGDFDVRARGRSTELWLRTHRSWLAGAAVAAGVAGWRALRA